MPAMQYLREAEQSEAVSPEVGQIRVDAAQRLAGEALVGTVVPSRSPAGAERSEGEEHGDVAAHHEDHACVEHKDTGRVTTTTTTQGENDHPSPSAGGVQGGAACGAKGGSILACLPQTWLKMPHSSPRSHATKKLRPPSESTFRTALLPAKKKGQESQ